MPVFPDAATIGQVLESIKTWFLVNVLSVANLAQVAVILVIFLGSRFAAPRLARIIEGLSTRRFPEGRMRQLLNSLGALILPVTWLVVVWLAEWIAVYAGLHSHVLRLVESLLAAWVVIRLTSSLVHNPAWARFIAVSAWVVAALNILGLLTATMEFLDSVGFSFAGLRVSTLTVVRGVAMLAILLWLAVTASQIIERRVRTLTALTPSLQVLLAKLLKVVLVTIAVVAALGSAGINLTAFTVFSGAIGLGIGFGLQKAVSNLVSGVIILLDRSIKPGDVIALGDTYGWIASLGARYVSVVTRDGTEHLIPNEELITQRVENWSYSNSLVRLRLPIGISYRSDVRKAIKLITEAAQSVARVLPTPPPLCLLKEFGSSSVDLELRFWITDPYNGLSNVKSDVLLNVWDLFHEHGIEIPFTQQDLHLRSAVPLHVAMEQPAFATAGDSAPRAAALAAGTE